MFPQIFGKYVLEREIASGGMAVVYLATLRGAGGFEKRLVVKQIRSELASDDAFLRRFVAEAKTTVELSHPNIVPVYELGVEQGVYFIAMELAEGATLAELLRAAGRLDPEEGAYLGVEILRALDYAHRKAGIVHRDVTPRNVLIDEEGAVRLIDFGIAAPVSRENPRRERVFGSPGHMPPEQREGGRLTPATDVFAVGALLLEAWTGHAPFRRGTTEESDLAVRERAPPPSRTDPALSPLDDLVSRATAVEASERPQTAEDFARPLRDFLRSSDLGDIARRLGKRVRSARRALNPRSERPPARTSERTPAGPVTPILKTPATPATKRLDPVTETFATRDEVVEWTHRGSDFPKADASVADTERDRRPSSASWIRGVALAGAAAVAIAAAAVTTRRPPEQPAAVISAPIAPFARPPAPPVSAEAPSATPPATVASAGPPPEIARSADTTPQAAEPGFLNLSSDLQATKVSVDGISVGRTPIQNLRRSAGKHSVTFVSVDLGEHLSTSLDLRPGESLRIVAQFTRPEPAIIVRR